MLGLCPSAILSLYFACGVRVSSKFIDLYASFQFSQHHLLKNLSSFFKKIIYFNWRLITLQYCSGFCHTLT